MQFTDVLVKNGFISQEDLQSLFSSSREENVSVEDLLKARGILGSQISEAKAEVMGVPYRIIEKKDISFDILKRIPEEAARHYKFVPLAVKDDVLEIGMVDPLNIEAKEALQFTISKLNIPFKIFLISEDDFNSVMSEYKGLGGEVTKVLGELEMAVIEAGDQETIPEEIIDSNSKQFIEEAPVTKMVAVILKHAVTGNASDIHIEPTGEKVKVRFRVDGVLRTSIVLPAHVHDAIVSRIKILSNLKLDEKRKPQDNRFGARINNRAIDFRVSTFPTFFGEKVVIRILDPEKGINSLEDLGLSGRNLEVVRRGIKKPYGIILVTGPTGSGKSTTLYSMLHELDVEKNNVVSLEDPVEYNIKGVSQSQVRPEIGYDFASGLRSILRQDPDMIMVGEIRDKETAALAIHAALTGHLVFSTLHTNSAVGAIPRLIDMGVDPFLLAPTLTLVMGQRLSRKLCPNSRKEIAVEGFVKEKIEREMAKMPLEVQKELIVPNAIYQGIPSPVCPQGAKGRKGLFEVLEKTPEIEEMLLKNTTEPAVLAAARKQGMRTMREEGMKAVFNGIISLEEIDRL